MPKFTPKVKDYFYIDSHKIHLHPKEVSQWLDGNTVYPIYVEVSPVGHCNHRCTFCAVDYLGYKVQSIPKDVMKSAIDSMSECGVKSIMFAGEGEPLLYKGLAEIITYCKNKYIDVAITTNYVAGTHAFFRGTNGAVKWIKISLNGGAQSYQTIHKANDRDYERVWNNIEESIKIRDSLGWNTVIGIQSVLLPDNRCDMVEIAERARDTGCDYFVVKPYSQHHKSITREYENITYRDEYDELLEELSEISTTDFNVIARTSSMESWDSQCRGYTKCHATPHFWAYIMSTGDVYGCSAYLGDDRFNYGNIITTSFKDIWNGQRRLTNQKFVDNELDITECRKNCRMDKVNKYLDKLKTGTPHQNFI